MSAVPEKEPSGVTAKKETDGQEQKKDATLASVSDVFSFGEGKSLLLLGGIICSTVTGCVFPAMAFLFAESFEDLAADATGEEFMKNIRFIAYSFMVLGVVAFTSMSLQAVMMETAAGIMARDLKNKWFRALLRQDLAYYDIKDVSGTATVITSSGNKFKKGVGRKFGEMIQYIITFLGGLAYAFISSWKSSLVVLAVVPFMSLSTLFLVKMNTTQTTRSRETYAEAGSIVYTTVSSIRTIFSLNAVPNMVEKFKLATQKAYEGAASSAHLMGLANGSMMGSFLLAYIAITMFGAWLLYDAIVDTGCDPSGAVDGVPTCDPSGTDIFGSLMGITFAAAVLPQVSVCIEAFVGARAACYPCLQVINRKVGAEPEDLRQEGKDRGSSTPLPKYSIDSSSGAGIIPSAPVEGKIVFEQVNFAYPTRQETEVFNGFNLTIEPGKTVALVGPSGSGKSTSVQLIERFYDPLSGSVSLDGTNLRDINVKWLRSQIGLVGQEPSLFACSIRDNILYGKPDATQEEIEEAARLANCHDFIKSFPEGYDTHVGDKGAQLSGGQKQRIAIARVLVKQPKILLLDEATSALDSESERIVQDALDSLLEKGGRTTVIIAHRLSTIRNADLIAVVHEGRIAESGTHEELLAQGGHYCSLVEAQKGKREDTDDESSGTESGPPSRNASTVDFTALDEESNSMLTFRDVHFRYPSRPNNKIFRGLNLSIREGETIALVGPSGHGKSTIIQMIERFYDPEEGAVEFLGTNIKELNVTWLRDQIGLVSQEPTLFDTTIAENIRYGLPDASTKQIEEAAKKANIHHDIMIFPEQYDTMVGAGGTQVSGGQKQRIAIARALLKNPRILLLDEATSALDSESEKVVQVALDDIMASKQHTCVVIAHRLSTIRNADRIAVIADGKVREIGTHDELMAQENSHYRRLKMFQDLDVDEVMKDKLQKKEDTDGAEIVDAVQESALKDKLDADEIEKTTEKANSKRAWLMATQDRGYFFIGSVGACLAGLVFPGWGFIFAYMIDLLYQAVLPCEDGVIPPPEEYNVLTCAEYYDDIADKMFDKSLKITYGCIGTIAATCFGNMLLYYGFNVASERMNKRVRDAAFTSLVRQEVGYFDLTPTSILTSRLSDDAALLHSFSGEPIRTLIMNTSSVLVGLVVSFAYMWPFALLTLGILPFMAFGAEMEMKMYMGEDEAVEEEDENSPGSIVVETLLNIRTVASMTIEGSRADEFLTALLKEEPNPIRSNFVKGMAAGLGQFVQMWGMALMFWWGGWLLSNYPNTYSYRGFLISMFSLLFSLSGMGVAAQGATDREKAKLAAYRIFELTDREPAIDPLDDGGKKHI